MITLNALRLHLAKLLLVILPSVSWAQTNAIEHGLAWLAFRQRADGSWSTNVALNSLPMLAFLSAGRPKDPVVERGLDFVLEQQAPDGAFTAGGAMMYGHGITTLLLAELTGMTKRDADARAALEKAVTLILRSQAIEKADIHAGGWRYEPTSTDSDISVTVWQIVALEAASDVGVSVPREAMERAIAYVKRCEHSQGGFGYQPGGLPNQSRTAAAILALRLCGLRNDPPAERARHWLAGNPLTWESAFFYYAAHHCAHAGVGFDERLVLEHQNVDGSWPAAPNSPDEAKAGPLYTASMAVLALTAKRNYLPAFLP